MKTMLETIWSRPASFILSFLFFLGLCLPGAASAVKQISNGHGGTGGDEGDPIDGNDFGTGGGGGDTDDDLHNDLGYRSLTGSWFLPVLGDGTRILILPEFKDGVIFIQLVFLDDQGSGAEAH
ncbi:MAG: hypothetical protein ABIK96_12295 [bacterium]